MNKKAARIRRGRKTRLVQKKLGLPRLCVTRSNVHMTAQVLAYVDGKTTVVAMASTQEKAFKDNANTPKVDQSQTIGKLVAERAIEQGIKRIAFDRSGMKYHGRVAAVANAAREAGLEF